MLIFFVNKIFTISENAWFGGCALKGWYLARKLVGVRNISHINVYLRHLVLE